MNILPPNDSMERQHYLFHRQYPFKLKPRLLYAGTLNKSPGWSEIPHTHEFCEIIFISDGQGYITAENEQREVKRGDIVIYNSGVLHAEACTQTEPLEIKFMALDHLEITDLQKNHLLPPGFEFIYPTDPYIDTFINGFNSMITEIENSDTYYTEIAESIVRTLLMYLLRIMNQQENVSSIFQSNKNLSLAVQYIKDNYRNHISLEDISAHCYLNKYYLSHLFTEMQGMSIGKYIQMLRLKEAMRRLRETNDSVSIVGRSVGFSDTGYFCRIFKKETGLSPLQYRQSLIPK